MGLASVRLFFDATLKHSLLRPIKEIHISRLHFFAVNLPVYSVTLPRPAHEFSGGSSFDVDLNRSRVVWLLFQ